MSDEHDLTVNALQVVFKPDGSVDYYLPVRVPALSEDDWRLAMEEAGKLQRKGASA